MTDTRWKEVMENISNTEGPQLTKEEMDYWWDQEWMKRKYIPAHSLIHSRTG